MAMPAAAQRGAITRPQNLAELTEEASVVVRGQVLSSRVEAHPQYRSLTTVVVTLRVEETLKGSASRTFTFRQYVWDLRDRVSGLGYRKGQHVLLLLTAPSPIGLSSPVGLEQGRFRIARDAQGREVATNGYGNAGLLSNLGSTAERKGIALSAPQRRMATEHRRGPIALEELRGLILRFAGGRP
jgi:hypothetical protein